MSWITPIYIIGAVIIFIVLYIKWFLESQEILNYSRQRYKKEAKNIPLYASKLPGLSLYYSEAQKSWLNLLKNHPEDKKLMALTR